MRLLKRYERQYLKFSCLNPRYTASLSNAKMVFLNQSGTLPSQATAPQEVTANAETEIQNLKTGGRPSLRRSANTATLKKLNFRKIKDPEQIETKHI